jgi:hypothetical protein
MLKILERLLADRADPDNVARLAFTAAALIFGYCEFVMVAGAGASLSQLRRRDLIDTLKALLE